MDNSMVAMYLAPFGYDATSAEEWKSTSSAANDLPELTLGIGGHCETGGHTLYALDCRLISETSVLDLKWQTSHRLKHLREDLHDTVKNELGKRYTRIFAQAPFAKKGGFAGTTKSLQKWLATLTAIVNEGQAPPALVAQLLLFLQAPAQSGHHTSAQTVGSADLAGNEFRAGAAHHDCELENTGGEARGAKTFIRADVEPKDAVTSTSPTSQKPQIPEEQGALSAPCFSLQSIFIPDEPSALPKGPPSPQETNLWQSPSERQRETMKQGAGSESAQTVPDQSADVGVGLEPTSAELGGTQGYPGQGSDAEKAVPDQNADVGAGLESTSACLGGTKGYLQSYGYQAATASEWSTSLATSLTKPQLNLGVKGHAEVDGHTLYSVHCKLKAGEAVLNQEWSAECRLTLLREGLHDVVKEDLGDRYSQLFAHAPFARRGGLSGTTGRLQTWLETVANCVNEGVASPLLVAHILKFFGAPHARSSKAPSRRHSVDKPKPVALVQHALEESVSTEARPDSPNEPFTIPRRSKDASNVSSDDEQREATDDENASAWPFSPERRRAGYGKLRDWFKELKRRLERSLKTECAGSERP